VDAEFSGAALTGPEGLVVEGVRGTGDAFMVGSQGPDSIPELVMRDVTATVATASAKLGAVRLEWVHDGQRTWVVQLHVGASNSSGSVIYPGEPTRERRFDVSRGLEELREVAADMTGTGEGLVLVGSVGITSHFGDVLRRAQIPSRLEMQVSS
jgi:hypothetical protein